MKTVGILGVGNIADVYVHTLKRAANCRIVAVAARDAKRTRERAARWGVEADTPESLIARADVDVILNLTPPIAHFETTRAALQADKHVFSEKPLGIHLAEARGLVELAAERGLRLGVAPDTLLGPGFQTARAMIEQGRIGRPLMASASILYHGADTWHPNPAFFYRAEGGGPIHDVGPYFLSALINLLGPIEEVIAQGFRGFETRTFSAEGSQKGLTVPVEVLTSVLALLSFRSGVKASLCASWDVWKSDQPAIEVHGTGGSMQLPHPAWHGGELKFAPPTGEWSTISTHARGLAQPNWPPQHPVSANYRGIGLVEMVYALEHGGPHRASAEVGMHVVEAADAIVSSTNTGTAIHLSLQPPQPHPITGEEMAELVDQVGL